MTPVNDTIAAIATPPGRGGIGIVRASGPAVPVLARGILGRLPAPRRAALCAFRDATENAIDHGLALYFPAPHSFTGEDILELHGHGGPVVLDLVLQRLLALGARAARPGEFSERAFINGKLDLAQAEAVADLIDSGSAAAARAAMRSLAGAFSDAVRALVQQLIDARAHIEAAIDFPEEEIDFLADDAIAARLDALAEGLADIAAGARQGRALRDGLTVALVGRPNAGKSSLLNALARYDAAIVSDVPGTTRDIVREQIVVDGLPVHILDTAGLRAATDAIEREGVRRTHAALAHADLALVVIDDSDSVDALPTLRAELPATLAVCIVRNKIDLSGRAPGGVGEAVAVSAYTGAGLDALRARLKEQAGYAGETTGAFSARRRHLDALRRARECVERARAQLVDRRGELIAEELRAAQQALNEITGEFTSDDLLGHIFASFCIGK